MIKNGFSPLRVQNWVYRLPYWKLICNNIYKEMVTLYHAVWTGASWLYMILQIHLVHVLYSHCLQGYQDSSWVVCKCFFNFTLCLVFYSHWLPGIMILFKLSWFLNITFYVFFIHIGYRGIIILHELSQCDSSNFLWVWLCILNGYRGITILCELSLNDSSI